MPTMSAQIPFEIMAEACLETQTRVILIGGQALGALGYQRVTLDLDFMITEHDYAKLKPAVEKHGYNEIVRTNVVAKMRAASEELIDIDFLFVDQVTFDGIQKKSCSKSFGGWNFFVPKPEHLIALKLHAIKQQPEKRELKDLNDIIELVRANQIDVHSPPFKALCLKFAPAGIYEKIQRALKTNG